jgi:hypothetical protein
MKLKWIKFENFQNSTLVMSYWTCWGFFWIEDDDFFVLFCSLQSLTQNSILMLTNKQQKKTFSHDKISISLFHPNIQVKLEFQWNCHFVMWKKLYFFSYVTWKRMRWSKLKKKMKNSILNSDWMNSL